MLKQYIDLPRPVHILCLGTFINRAGTFVVFFLTLYLKTDLDLGVTFATRAMGLFGLGAVAAALVGGQLADQIGRRAVMLISFFGGGVILVVLSFVTAPWAILLLVPAFALIAEMYRPATSAMIADLVTSAHRAHAFSLMYISINLGFAIGATAGGIVAGYSFRWLFWGDALTAAIYGLIIWLTIPETLPSRRKPALSEVDPTTVPQCAESPESSDASGRAIPLGAAVRHILRDGPFLVFCLATFLIALVFMQSSSTLPLYLDQLGFGPKDYGRVIALNGVLIVLFQLPLTRVLGRYHRGVVVAGGGLAHAIGFGLTGMAVGLWQFAATVAIWTFGEMMMAPFANAIVSDLAPTPLRARYMGVFTMSFSSSMIFAAPIGGAVLAHPRLGGGVLWGAAFGVAALASVLFFSIRRHMVPPPCDT